MLYKGGHSQARDFIVCVNHDADGAAINYSYGLANSKYILGPTTRGIGVGWLEDHDLGRQNCNMRLWTFVLVSEPSQPELKRIYFFKILCG